jgi:hypothetical protein
MYTQFFGNYLLSRNLVTKEQLFSAMERMGQEHMRLGTLAIHAGYMSSSEVDEVFIEQTHTDRKFGELAVEMGFLSNEQVIELLQHQNPDFLLLGQILVDDGVITTQDFENIIADYKSANELYDLDLTQDNQENIERLFDNFFVISELPISSFGKLYIELLFNNFVRFVGEDFAALDPEQVTEYPPECCICQKVVGDYSISSYLSMDEPTAIAFASRYVGDEFLEYDEYVRASMEDFLNLHNGLFVVNASNVASLELTITAPEVVTDPVIAFENRTYHFPVLYSFGTVHYILEVVKIPGMDGL